MIERPAAIFPCQTTFNNLKMNTLNCKNLNLKPKL